MDKKQKLQIAVATHKRFEMPSLSCYFPLHVGKGSPGAAILREYVGDDTGINISDKNPYYSELTGLFWLWKNVDAENIGMVHYRRYFRSGKRQRGRNRMDHILTEPEALRLLAKNDMILPRKQHYVIETLYSHYAHTHYAEHLDRMRTILEAKAPEYVDSFDKVMKKRSAHMYNMFIMKRDVCDEYCQWLFPLLAELEKKTDMSCYTPYQARLVGRVGELLLDVWIEKKRKSYCELPVIYMERVNWRSKGIAFLKAKYFGKKYDASF